MVGRGEGIFQKTNLNELTLTEIFYIPIRYSILQKYFCINFTEQSKSSTKNSSRNAGEEVESRSRAAGGEFRNEILISTHPILFLTPLFKLSFALLKLTLKKNNNLLL